MITIDWRRELRASVVSVVTILACFFTGWLIEDLASLHTDVVILSVVLAMQLTRRAHTTSHRHWLMTVLLLPAISAGAGGVAILMRDHIVVGDAVFTVGIAGAIWIRRFGKTAARAGTYVTMPLLAMLIAPAGLGGGGTGRTLWWNAVIALMVIVWVTALHYLGEWTGFLPVGEHSLPTGSAPARASRMRPPPSTRMAIQMGLTLGTAFLIGHQVFGPIHWTWLVLTAYIVPGGNRGRGDVVHKAILRLGGALVGTVAATLLSGTFHVHDRWAVVAILATLSVASYLRKFSYAYWAASVTASLAFMYGYFGETGTSLLHTRLEEIAIGAALAVVIAWFVLPVRTTDVLRRRSADALADLSEYVATARQGDHDDLPAIDRRVRSSLDDLRAAALPINRYRRIVDRGQRTAQTAAIVGQVEGCRTPVRELTRRLTADRAGSLDDDTYAAIDRLHRQVVASRRALAAGRRTARTS